MADPIPLTVPDPIAWLFIVGAVTLALFNIGRFVRAIKLDVLMGRFLAVALEPLRDMLADRVQEQIDVSTHRIWQELRPNHGTSIRDVVDRTERNVQSLRADLSDHEGDVKAHAADPTAHIRPSDPDDGAAGPR